MRKKIYKCASCGSVHNQEEKAIYCCYWKRDDKSRQENSKEKETSWVLGIYGIILFLVIGVFMIGYFKYVSIDEWMAKDNYPTNSEWFKQMGLFIATMMSFCYFINIGIELFDYLPILHKKHLQEKKQA